MSAEHGADAYFLELLKPALAWLDRCTGGCGSNSGSASDHKAVHPAITNTANASHVCSDWSLNPQRIVTSLAFGAARTACHSQQDQLHMAKAAMSLHLSVHQFESVVQVQGCGKVLQPSGGQSRLQFANDEPGSQLANLAGSMFASFFFCCRCAPPLLQHSATLIYQLDRPLHHAAVQGQACHCFVASDTSQSHP